MITKCGQTTFFFGHSQCLLPSVLFIPGPFPTSVIVQPAVVNQNAVRTILKRMSELLNYCCLFTIHINENSFSPFVFVFLFSLLLKQISG